MSGNEIHVICEFQDRQSGNVMLPNLYKVSPLLHIGDRWITNGRECCSAYVLISAYLTGVCVNFASRSEVPWELVRPLRYVVRDLRDQDSIPCGGFHCE